MYRYLSHESCSQFDSLPLTSLTLTQRDEESEEESDDYSPDTDESESDGAEYCDRRSVAAKTTAAPTPLAQAVARVKAARAARTEKGVKVQQVTLRRMVLSNAVAIGARLQYSFLHKGVEHSFEARLTIGVAARVVIAWSGQEFYSARKWTTTTKRTVKPGLSRSDVSPNLVVIPPDAAPGPAEASGGERCGTYWSDLVELCRKAIEKEREGKVLKTAANEAVDVAWAAAAAAAGDRFAPSFPSTALPRRIASIELRPPPPPTLPLAVALPLRRRRR